MKQISKITDFKKFSILILIVAITSVYLYLPNNANTLYEIDDEKTKELSKELGLFIDEEKDIDYSKGFKESFYVALPFSQIIEYKKVNFVYEIALNNSKDEHIGNVLNNILVHENDIHYVNSMRESNLKYALFQLLGVLTVLLVLIVLYFILKLKNPNFVKHYLFVVVIIYFVNLGFFTLKTEKEKSLIEVINNIYNK